MTRHVTPFGINLDKPFTRLVTKPERLALANEWVEVSNGAARLSPKHPIIVFRYPSRNDDSRTIIATAVPEAGFLFSKGYVHGLVHEPMASVESVLALLAYLNSLVADWWSRRFVDRHITNPIIENLPIPAWSSEQRSSAASLASELLARHGINSVPGEPKLTRDPVLSAQDDVEIRAAIERLALTGFDLGPDDLETILADFSATGCSGELRASLRGA